MFDNNHKAAIFWKNHQKEVILTVAFLAGGILRFLSARDNLWFDEIWSVNFARSMQSVLDVFSIHHDNNHILNTLWLYVVGTGDDWPRYRLLSLVAGTLTVPLIGYIASERGFAQGIMASILAAFSYPLIVYSSEARGYAPAMLCALGAYIALQNFHRRPKLKQAVFFWIFCVAGFLSHLTFILVFVGFVAYSILSEIKFAAPQKSSRNLFVLYGIPAGFIGMYYVLFVRSMALGGGQNIPEFVWRLSVFLAPVWGVFPESIEGVVLSLAGFAAVVAGIIIAERKNLPDFVFYAVVLIIIPLIAFVFPLKFFGARYLALLLPFLYLVMSSLFGRMAAKNKAGCAVSTFLVLALVVGNLTRINDQITIGRGKYLEAIQYMMTHSASSGVFIATDAPLRNETVIDFYKQFIPSDKKIYYRAVQDRWMGASGSPQWLVTHRAYHPDYVPPLDIDVGSHHYELVKIYPSANLISGWTWYLYQRD